jgi:hypothetical protein
VNCKQGDLAIVVRSITGFNLGKIVRCVRFLGHGPHECDVDGVPFTRRQTGPRWEIDPPLKTRTGGLVENSLRSIGDEFLRPLRGDLLDEETETGRELVHAR